MGTRRNDALKGEYYAMDDTISDILEKNRCYYDLKNMTQCRQHKLVDGNERMTVSHIITSTERSHSAATRRRRSMHEGQQVSKRARRSTSQQVARRTTSRHEGQQVSKRTRRSSSQQVARRSRLGWPCIASCLDDLHAHC